MYTEQERTRRIRNSAHFKNGSFQNLSPTPMKPADISYFKMIRDALSRPKSVRPPAALPAVKTDLNALQSEIPVIIWFGHSSYFIHCRGFTILVDPVFCGHASPFPFLVKAFKGADVYTAADMPAIDALILTHNHYDHLDIKTLASLKFKIREYYTPLRAGALLEKHRISAGPVNELDWWESIRITDHIQLTATPARHFSGRGLRRNKSLWASFMLDLFGYKLFLGGDSGYDTHFKTIGRQQGPFDLAILECGQYNASWPFIHMTPEETVQAAVDLQAKALLPVHWGKFALANHPWDEPVRRVLKEAGALRMNTCIPRIGEALVLSGRYADTAWWTGTESVPDPGEDKTHGKT